MIIYGDSPFTPDGGVVMNRNVLLTIGLLIALPLAGCTSNPELTKPNISLTVTAASALVGGCVFSAKDKVCHTLTVHVLNNNTKEDFSNNMFYWEAASSNGTIIKTPNTEGADAITPGNQGDLTLRFDSTGTAILTTLRYRAIWMSEAATAAIPPYAITPWTANIGITVTSAEKTVGGCIFGDDKTCHTIIVHVKNDNAKEKVDGSQFYWKGLNADGNSFNAYNVDGPDAISPGSQGDLTIQFEPSGDSNIAKVQYEASWMLEPETAAVPPY